MISIILPIRNEVKEIGKCLDAILMQDFPSDQIEIIIADGMSTDGTREKVKSYRKIHNYIHLIDNQGKIVSTGMNEAIKKSSGEIIIRVDGHTQIDSNYISTCVETLQRTSADNVGGCMTARANNVFGYSVAIATSTPFGIGNSKFHYSQTEGEVDSVYMGAWPRFVFSKIGLFDEELIRDQDDEFNYRLRANGGRIILNPDIRSIYTTRSTPSGLFTQYFQYGFYKIRVLQKHPRQMSIRQFVPPLFVLSLLAVLFLTLTTKWGWITLVAIAGSYILANLTASIITSAKKGWRHLSRLPVVFAIIHISYGSGFLAGLFKFWNRWGDKIGKVPQL